MGEKIWFVYVGDHHEGPFTVREIQQKIQEGKVARDAFVWKEGMGDWKPMAEVSEFQAPSTPAPASPLAVKFTPAAAPLLQESDDLGAAKKSLSYTLGAKGATPHEEEEVPIEDIPAERPRRRIRVSKTVVVVAVLGLLSLSLLQGWLDPVLNSPALRGTLAPIKLKLVDQFPSLAGIISPLADMPDVDPADHEVLRAAARGLVEQEGGKVAGAVSNSDLIAPQFYVTSNFPDGTVFEIRIIGIAETLLNATEFMATTQATIEKRVGKSDPIRAADGKPLPRGTYQVYIYESANQPPEAAALLSPLAASTARVAAEVPKGKKVIYVGTQFLGGPKDVTYTQRLKAYHDELKQKATNELADLKQTLATFEAQHTETLQQYAALKLVKNKAQRIQRWSAFTAKWSAINQQIVSRLQAFTPEVLRNNFFYGGLFELAQTSAAALQKIHALEHEYFTGTVDPKAFDIQHAEAESMVKSSLEALRAKITLAEQIPPSPSGMPRKEGL